MLYLFSIGKLAGETTEQEKKNNVEWFSHSSSFGCLAQSY
jgi:hypothetical protein